MVQKNEIPPILASNVRSNLWTYLHKPKYKEALADALTKHPELKNQLASTLFSEETRVNAWEVFYKNFKDLSPGEISFVQMYLCLFKNKSPEGVGY